MLITALRCPVLKPMRWVGEGSLWYHNPLCFETRVGLAFMQFLQMIFVLICRHAKPMTLLHLQCIMSRQLQK